MANLGIGFLREKVRPVTEADKDLPRFSFSKLEKFKNCPYGFYLQYEQGNYPPSETLALSLGSTLHKCLEEKAKYLMDNRPVDYYRLEDIMINGCVETNEKTREELFGIKDLSKTYLEEWYQKNEKNGLTYVDKLETFDKYLKVALEDDGYKPKFAEYQFEYVWDNRIRLYGFIDSVREDENGHVKLVDYKSSNATYQDTRLKTSLQFFVYQCALLADLDILADECEYDFILLGEKQKALSPGWEKRGIKAMDKILDSIDEMREKDEWKCLQSPLCFWCSFCKNNPAADEQYKYMCDYYSLWSPTDKTFAVNNRQPFDPKYEDLKTFSNGSNSKPKQTGNKPSIQERKLIF